MIYSCIILPFGVEMKQSNIDACSPVLPSRPIAVFVPIRGFSRVALDGD
jgi:hypothetical protein